MAHREFYSADGRVWTAWSVHPEYAERRSAPSTRASGPVRERRVRHEVRARLTSGFSHGWLVFETRGEKRRLAPYPGGWSMLSDGELVALLQTATEVPHIRGRLLE